MNSPRCMATMIGSLPMTDPQKAVDLVFAHLHEAPIWPELPNRSLLEGMIHAHTHALPCLELNEQKQRLFINTAKDCSHQLAEFYERAMKAEQTGDVSDFAVSPEYASALELTAQRLESLQKTYPFVKVQSVGPITFQLQLTDEQERPLYYDETFQDVLLRQIALQSRWMVRRFVPYGEGVIAFLDEPALAAFGSSGYLGVLREHVVHRLGEAIAALHEENAVVGVHVCGNSEWSMIMEAGADIINYDAYEFGSSLMLYAKPLLKHLKEGGVIAWGIVPTSAAALTETPESLERRLFSLVDELEKLGVERELVLAQSMITPACGMGSVPGAQAKRVVELLDDLSRRVQDKVR